MSPSPRPLALDDVVPTNPSEDADLDIAVVVQVNMPEQTQETVDLNRELIMVAVATLHVLGARVEIHDVSSDADPDYSAIRAADGILVLGGGDVDATLYGFVEPVPNEYGKDRRADERELQVIRQGISDDSTMLCLCRGSQLLNVACGGSVIPDLEPFELHKGGPGEPLFVDEAVTLLEGTRLRRIYGRDRIVVRSGHHQAVDRVGDGLREAARAADGITEATEHIDSKWIVGLQWHPEESGTDEMDRLLIFGEFIRQARSRMV